MTRDETKGFLKGLSGLYPSLRNVPTNEKSNMVNAWASILGAYSFELVIEAFKIYLHQDKSNFPPSPQAIIGNIENIIFSQSKCLDERSNMEILSEIQRACSNGIYNSQREYDNLSEIAQRVVGSPSYIHEMAISEGGFEYSRARLDSAITRAKSEQRERLCQPKQLQELISSVTLSLETKKEALEIQETSTNTTNNMYCND